jgi:hypothetical protein
MTVVAPCSPRYCKNGGTVLGIRGCPAPPDPKIESQSSLPEWLMNPQNWLECRRLAESGDTRQNDRTEQDPSMGDRLDPHRARLWAALLGKLVWWMTGNGPALDPLRIYPNPCAFWPDRFPDACGYRNVA